MTRIDEYLYIENFELDFKVRISTFIPENFNRMLHSSFETTLSVVIMFFVRKVKVKLQSKCKIKNNCWHFTIKLFTPATPYCGRRLHLYWTCPTL